jgi:hypothetical protein
MKDLMVDLETMGDGPRAAIVSIGAVRFDLKTGDVGAFLHEPVSLVDSVRLGLEMTPGTVLWWMKQSPEAQASWNVQHPKLLAAGLGILTRLVGEGTARATTVWANAPTFDCVILKNAYQACGLPVPWKHYTERCMRTLVDLASDTGFDPKATTRKGTAHSALDDCYHQIEVCCRAYRHLHGA